ncbi:uncharacterized protein TM35_000951050 [Trypanosoma theileri]|uniref:Mucin-associated surface protein (MASP) n=1 Tax=Trypanosoma theileri TaxID=67003 RepID=A0A1X0NEM3_9TRYP|nr:uncharacterized protein TM35_000951050 [Trypanosoma theileri]ORC82240.1 hypothetical protein TM35_000951050 [Trypanosoma theileri]
MMMMMRRVMCVLAVVLCCTCGYTMTAAAAVDNDSPSGRGVSRGAVEVSCGAGGALRVRPAAESEWLTCGAGSRVSACGKYADLCSQQRTIGGGTRGTTTTAANTIAGQPKAVMAIFDGDDYRIAERLLHNLSLEATADDVKNAKKEADARQVELKKNSTKPPAAKGEGTLPPSGAHPAAPQLPGKADQSHDVNPHNVDAGARPGAPDVVAATLGDMPPSNPDQISEESPQSVDRGSENQAQSTVQVQGGGQPQKPNATSSNEDADNQQGVELAVQEQEGEPSAAPPSAPENSSNNSLTETSNESNAAESVVTNITNNAENTTTTTTTTTTPPVVPSPNPEISNIATTVQKNANADKSLSPLWVRVSLLIVVTLACILVC